MQQLALQKWPFMLPCQHSNSCNWTLYVIYITCEEKLFKDQENFFRRSLGQLFLWPCLAITGTYM